VSVTGDGAFALQRHTHTSLGVVRWSENTPFYPAYTSTGHIEAFLLRHRDRTDALIVHECKFETEGALQPDLVSSSHYTAEDGIRGYEGEFDAGHVRSIALFSDGIEQVDTYMAEAVVRELMAFKSTTGQFVTRRMNRFLADCAKRGKGQLDDISYAVIACDHS
jgi:hypothetical protein